MFVQHVIEMASKSTEKADRKNTKRREIREAEKKERKKEEAAEHGLTQSGQQHPQEAV